MLQIHLEKRNKDGKLVIGGIFWNELETILTPEEIVQLEILMNSNHMRLRFHINLIIEPRTGKGSLD